VLTSWLCSHFRPPRRISLVIGHHHFHQQRQQQQQPAPSCHSDLLHTTLYATCIEDSGIAKSAFLWIPDETRNLENCASPGWERMHTIMRDIDMARWYCRWNDITRTFDYDTLKEAGSWRQWCQVQVHEFARFWATYVRAFLRHWADAYAWAVPAVGWPMSF